MALAAMVLAGPVAGSASAQLPPPNSSPEFPVTEDGRRSVDENTGPGQNIGTPVTATDPNDDTLTYTLSGSDAAAFDIVTTSGQLQTKAALDHESRDSYSVTVTATDISSLSADIDVTIAVTNVDEAATVSLWPVEPRVGGVLRATLSDPDGGVSSVSWRWDSSDDSSNWTNLSHDEASYTPTTDDTGKYLRASVSYRDAEGSGKSEEAVSDHQVAGREAAPDITVVEMVTGLSHPWDLAFTPDGTMLFTQRSGVLSSRLTDGTVQVVTADFSDLHANRTAGLMAIVTDPDFTTNRRFYTCQAHTEADQPNEVQVIAWTINADHTEATRVADPLVGGMPIGFGLKHAGCRMRFGSEGYLWIATGDGVAVSGAQGLSSLGGKVLRVDASTGAGAPGNPFTTSPRVYSYGHRNPQGLALRPGTTEMWLVDHGPNWDDEINLLASGGNYGWDPSLPDSPTAYNEAVPMTDVEKFPGAVEAQWSSGEPTLATSGGIFLEGADWDQWNGRLAVATLKGQSLRLFKFASDGALVSHIAVPELDRTYGRLRAPMLGPDGALYVTTSNGSGDRILKIAPSRPPAFAGPTHAVTVPENSPPSRVVATVAATDPDGEVLTYALGGLDAALFNIASPAVGQVRAAASLDHEAGSGRKVVVTASDPYGLSDSITVMIVVTDVNEKPAVSGPAIASHEENATGVVTSYTAADPESGTVEWRLSGPDAGKFDINASGDLTFKAPPDFEARADANRNNLYEVTVEAYDGGLTGSREVTVSVTNAEEAGTVALSSPQPQTDDELTATLTDPDGSIAGLVWTWERSQTRSGWEVIDGAASRRYTPTVSDLDHYLRVTATYNDGHSQNKSARQVSEHRVQIAPGSNSPPSFSGVDLTREVAENSAPTTPVGAPVVAEDPDGDTLAYALTGGDTASFTVDTSTGQLLTRVALDQDRQTTHTVEVTATDPSNASDSITVIITVTGNTGSGGGGGGGLDGPAPGGAGPGDDRADSDAEPAATSRFSDIPDDAWYLAHIEHIADLEITTGHPDGTYRPHQPVTRAHMAAFLSRTLGGPPTGAEPAATSRFSDIPDDAWYLAHIEHIADLEITTGHPDGTYRPHQPVTRAHMAAFLSRTLGGPPTGAEPAATSRFSDIPDDAWYLAHIEHIADLEITTGHPDGTYRPHQPVTRAHMAAFLSRLVNHSASLETDETNG